jgi:hypothetical protein
MKRTSLIIALIFVSIGLPGIVAEVTIVRGATVVLEQSEGVIIKEANAAEAAPTNELPRYISGLFNIESNAPGMVSMATSSGVFMEYYGPGKFDVERFEEILLSNAEGNYTELFQMLLNMREGVLCVDASRLPDGNEFMVVTPVGRIFSGPARWILKVNFNKSIRDYNIELENIEGVVRYVSTQNKSYDVVSSRRVVGAKSGETFLSEFDKISLINFEQLENFIEKSAIFTTAYDPAGLFRKLEPLRTRESLDAASPDSIEKESIIIQNVPKQESNFPFRGLVAPPSTRETDLF